jgi:hypothetical protein
MRVVFLLALALALAVPARAATFSLIAPNTTLYVPKTMSATATAHLKHFCAQHAVYVDGRCPAISPLKGSDVRAMHEILFGVKLTPGTTLSGAVVAGIIADDGPYTLLCENVAVYAVVRTTAVGSQESSDGGATWLPVHDAPNTVESDEFPVSAALLTVHAQNGHDVAWVAVSEFPDVCSPGHAAFDALVAATAASTNALVAASDAVLAADAAFATASAAADAAFTDAFFASIAAAAV